LRRIVGTKETRNKTNKEKREEKDDLGNLFDYPTLSLYIKQSVIHLSVWPAS
jgi:hypothetical protein